MQKTEFIEKLILMIIDFMLHQILAAGSRYVTIPSDLRFIRYVQLTDSSGNQTFLEKKDTQLYGNFL